MRAVIVRLIDLILSCEDLIVFCVIYDSEQTWNNNMTNNMSACRKHELKLQDTQRKNMDAVLKWQHVI